MESFTLNEDILLLCNPAPLFPDAVLEAHQQLHSRLPDMDKRRFFGISWLDEQGNIVYQAAVEALQAGEAESLGVTTFTLQKGLYSSIFIPDFRKDIPAIGKAFDQLMADPAADPAGICIEWYAGMDDVHCLLKLRSNQQ